LRGLKGSMLLVAMLTIAVVVAAPALAQVSEGFSERRVQSGPATPKVDTSSSGNNINLCAAVLQAANTGNVANEQGAAQYKSEADDISFEGTNITINPSLVDECTQTIEQATVAGGKSEAKAGEAEAKAGEAKVGDAKAKELPRTGGADLPPLLGVGASILLVAGGLLAARPFGGKWHR
jgi:LPXTG-motif cell wall-anchored protein